MHSSGSITKKTFTHLAESRRTQNLWHAVQYKADPNTSASNRDTRSQTTDNFTAASDLAKKDPSPLFQGKLLSIYNLRRFAIGDGPVTGTGATMRLPERCHWPAGHSLVHSSTSCHSGRESARKFAGILPRRDCWAELEISSRTGDKSCNIQCDV